MLEICCRLTCLLNDLSAGRTTAPHAEAELASLAAAHHVHDPDEVLGMPQHDPLASVPVRMALARVSHAGGPTRWGLLLPVPGSPAGLRGPAEVTVEAIEEGAVVVAHESVGPVAAGTLWLPQPVGAGMQWTIRAARPPLPPPTPAEAGPRLRALMSRTAGLLTDLGVVAGDRPSVTAPRLTGHPARDQRLLDTAWVVLAACRAGLDSSDRMLTAHGTEVREKSLRSLQEAARQAITAAVSWPS